MPAQVGGVDVVEFALALQVQGMEPPFEGFEEEGAAAAFH